MWNSTEASVCTAGEQQSEYKYRSDVRFDLLPLYDSAFAIHAAKIWSFPHSIT